MSKVFDDPPMGVRKCILSTNVAETSITIDGIRFVCDSGREKEMGVERESNVQSLQEKWISRASANQRKGRAGRTGPGLCFRLYSEVTNANDSAKYPINMSQERYEKLRPFPVPEIHRISLSAVVLEIKSLDDSIYRLSYKGAIMKFPFLDPPEEERLRHAVQLLENVSALNSSSDLFFNPSAFPDWRFG